MEKIDIQKARRLFDEGVTIYFVPADMSNAKRLLLNNYINKTKESNFEISLGKFKQMVSRRVHYYVDMEEIKDKEVNKNEKLLVYRITTYNKSDYLYCMEIIDRLGFVMNSSYDEDWNYNFEVCFTSKYIPKGINMKVQAGYINIERV